MGNSQQPEKQNDINLTEVNKSDECLKRIIEILGRLVELKEQSLREYKERCERNEDIEGSEQNEDIEDSDDEQITQE